jgi:hypothetical protein
MESTLPMDTGTTTVQHIETEFDTQFRQLTTITLLTIIDRKGFVPSALSASVYSQNINP